MRREGGDGAETIPTGPGGFPVHDGTEPELSESHATGRMGLLTDMIRILLSEADEPPREVEGVSEEFCDGMCASFLLSAFTYFARVAGIGKREGDIYG